MTIISLMLSLALLNLYILLSQNVLMKISELKGRIAIEAFIDPGFNDTEIMALQKQIAIVAGVDSVDLIDKAEALEKFKEMFSADYSQLIDENPLPQSFQIKLNTEGSQEQVQNAIDIIKSMEGIDEVKYHHKLLTSLNYYYRRMQQIFIFVGVGLAVLGFFLLWVNLKLTLKTKARIIETMELVGAKQSLIRGPFYVQALVEGTIAGFGAVLLVTLLFWIFRAENLLIIKINFISSLMVVGGSIFFSIFTCFWAIRGRF